MLRILVALSLIGIALHPASAAERVQFESARYQVGPLQQRLARERGESVPRPPAEIISGYLTKPDGPGPFPAVVHLHGCAGLPKAIKAGNDQGFWSERLAGWGYAVLVVDSFTTRGIEQACTGIGTGIAGRIADAYGALAYLSAQPFVDAKRIALLGFSQGAITALSLVGARDFEIVENEAEHHFKAAITFYPSCPAEGAMTVPTLILIGALDDWTPASACTTMIKNRGGAGSPVRLVIYPGTHHGFDIVSLQPGREVFGHHVEYNETAAHQAIEEVGRFLAEHLTR
ncbi:MAG: dienelactone hydrolase family protein [Xanthobacteraceae bacterium]